jgi:hypothetical protein
MPGLPPRFRCRFAHPALAALLAVLLAACASNESLISAAKAVSESFRVDYERILKERGTRVYPRRREDAVYRLRTAALQLGMRIESYDIDLGYVRFSGPAPQPLTLHEWGDVASADLPKMRAIVEKYVGSVLKWAVPFETDGLDIVINATAVPVSEGSEISLSMRMRELEPPQSGFPRREYPPPTGVQKGLDKIWAAIDAAMEVKPLPR